MIDIHTHPEYFKCGEERLSIPEAIDTMLAPMNAFGVRLCGLLGFNVLPFQDEEEVRTVNNHTAAMIAARPDRFFGFVFINPLSSPDFLNEELDRCLQLPGFRGIKLELDMNCRDRRLDPVMAKAIEYSVPVLHHSWDLNPWCMSEDELKMQENRSEPHDIADLARRFPEAKIIMAHLEGCGVRGILEVADLENVWIDTSGSQPFTGTLEFAVKTIGSSRILFGSDLLGRGLSGQLGRIMGARIAEEDREKILSANARTLFNINW